MIKYPSPSLLCRGTWGRSLSSFAVPRGGLGSGLGLRSAAPLPFHPGLSRQIHTPSRRSAGVLALSCDNLPRSSALLLPPSCRLFSSKPSALSCRHILPRQQFGLTGFDELKESYRSAVDHDLPPAACVPVLDEMQCRLTTELHAARVAKRFVDMLEARSSTDPAHAMFLRLARGLSFQKAEMQSLGDPIENFLERVHVDFSLSTPDGGSVVPFAFEWDLSSRDMPGMSEREFSAVLRANDQLLVEVSDCDLEIDSAGFQDMAVKFGVDQDAALRREFQWFIVFLATYPSDAAFDCLSDAFSANLQ